MPQRFTIEVSGAELGVIRLAIGRMCEPKPVRERKTAPVAMRPVVNTGDRDLDAWMRRQYDRGVKPYVVKPTPRPAPLKPRVWTKDDYRVLAHFNEAAVAAWRRLGHEVIITGGTIDADGANVRVLS